MKWKAHPKYEFLDVSDTGLVRYNVDTRKNSAGFRPKSRINRRGYVEYMFTRPSTNKQIFRNGHRLVAEAWLENPSSLPMVHHKDHDKTNNHLSNLEWTTNRRNQLEAVKAGRLIARRGELCSSAKLDRNQVNLIRILYKYGGCSQQTIGDAIGVSQTQIGRIVRYEHWATHNV